MLMPPSSEVLLGCLIFYIHSESHMGLLRTMDLTNRPNPYRPVIINHLSNKGVLLGIKL